MKKNTYLLNTILAALLGTVLLIAILFRTFAPRIILMELDIPNMALISLVTLLADHYLAPGAKRCYICIPVFAALTFGLLPFLCGLILPRDILRLALCGAAVFTLTTWLYTSLLNRIATGPVRKAAPIVSAFGLYLAFQCFAGILL